MWPQVRDRRFAVPAADRSAANCRLRRRGRIISRRLSNQAGWRLVAKTEDSEIHCRCLWRAQARLARSRCKVRTLRLVN